MIRKIDELGRITLPREIKRALNLKEEDELEPNIEGILLIIKKAIHCCIFCDKKNIWYWLIIRRFIGVALIDCMKQRMENICIGLDVNRAPFQ